MLGSRGGWSCDAQESTAALLEQCEVSLATQAGELDHARRELREAHAALREAQDQLLRVEAFIGAAQMQEAQRRRGWLRALAPSRLINIVAG